MRQVEDDLLLLQHLLDSVVETASEEVQDKLIHFIARTSAKCLDSWKPGTELPAMFTTLEVMLESDPNVENYWCGRAYMQVRIRRAKRLELAESYSPESIKLQFEGEDEPTVVLTDSFLWRVA